MAKTTGQTGQTAGPGQGKTPYFEIAKDEEGKWQWCLWSANGRPMVRSAVSYGLVKDALAAIRSARAGMAQAGPVFRTDPDGSLSVEGVE